MLPPAKPTQAEKEALVKAALAGVTASPGKMSTPGRGCAGSACTMKLGYSISQKGVNAGAACKSLNLQFTLGHGEHVKVQDPGWCAEVQGHGGSWYVKATYTNMMKPATPEVANKILALLKTLCPQSAASYPEELEAPESWKQPELKIVKVPSLEIDTGSSINDPTFFFVGDTYVWKEAMKAKYNKVEYGGILFGGEIKPAWHMAADPVIENPETGVVVFFNDHGIDATLIDLCQE